MGGERGSIYCDEQILRRDLRQPLNILSHRLLFVYSQRMLLLVGASRCVSCM